jgi:hypothetical protein
LTFIYNASAVRKKKASIQQKKKNFEKNKIKKKKERERLNSMVGMGTHKGVSINI